METDVVLRRGGKEMPVVVFIHGLGMSHSIWTRPEQERVFFGNAPLTVLIKPRPPVLKGPALVFGRSEGPLQSLFHVLEDEGFNLLAYSQARPSARIEVAMEELHTLLTLYESLCKKGVIFVCHSRGGLILRAYLQKYRPSFGILAFFSLACPHGGSSLAMMAKAVNSILKPLEYIFQDRPSSTLFRSTISRLVSFLSSDALKELLPGSEFINSLDEESLKYIPIYCFGGTNPRLLVLYKWNKNCLKYEEFLRLPDFLTDRFSSLWPEEMVPGKGDGLVCLKRSVTRYARGFYTFDCNHAEIIYEPEVHRQVIRLLREEI